MQARWLAYTMLEQTVQHTGLLLGVETLCSGCWLLVMPAIALAECRRLQAIAVLVAHRAKSSDIAAQLACARIFTAFGRP